MPRRSAKQRFILHVVIPLPSVVRTLLSYRCPREKSIPFFKHFPAAPPRCAFCLLVSTNLFLSSFAPPPLPAAEQLISIMPQKSFCADNYLLTLNAPMPGYTALAPSSSSMRSSWLYFATRSVRLGAPVLIWQVLSATARSAMVVSSVSPER